MTDRNTALAPVKWSELERMSPEDVFRRNRILERFPGTRFRGGIAGFVRGELARFIRELPGEYPVMLIRLGGVETAGTVPRIHEFPLLKPVWIGRSERADIPLSDPAVSALHARIQVTAGKGLTVYDPGSRNGTFIRGRELTRGIQETISWDDVVRIGSHHASFSAEGRRYPDPEVQSVSVESGICSLDVWRLLFPAGGIAASLVPRPCGPPATLVVDGAFAAVILSRMSGLPGLGGGFADGFGSLERDLIQYVMAHFCRFAARAAGLHPEYLLSAITMDREAIFPRYPHRCDVLHWTAKLQLNRKAMHFRLGIPATEIYRNPEIRWNALDPREQRRLEELGHIPVPLCVRMALAGLKAAEWRALRPGDVVLCSDSGWSGTSGIPSGRVCLAVNPHDGMQGIPVNCEMHPGTCRVVINETGGWISMETDRELAKNGSAPGDGAEADPVVSEAVAENILLPVTVELGRVRMPLKSVIRLTPGQVIELDRRLEDPVDIISGNRRIAVGRLVQVGERMGVEIARIAGDTE